MIPLAVCRSPQRLSALLNGRHEPFAAAHAQVLAALGARPPRALPIWPQAGDVEDRREYLRGVLEAMHAYLRAVLEDVAQNVPRDLDLRQIEALCCDLTSEVTGALNRAAEALPGSRS